MNPQNKNIKKKIIIAIAIAAGIILTVALVKSNKKIGPAQIGPAIPDNVGKNNSLIKDGSKIPVGGNEIKKDEVQEKIIISLPYKSSQPTKSIVPMGETLYHPNPPNPGGHPGIDFQWNLGTPIDIIASYAGKVSFAERTSSHNKWDVYVESGKYTIVYAELETMDSEIIKGAQVVLGQRIGEPGKFNGNYYNMHWELRLGTERICPLNYFDSEAKTRIEKSWSKTDGPELKRNASEICSNYYKGKDK